MTNNTAPTQWPGGESHCSHCGTVIDSSYRYCPGCGAAVQQPKEPSVSGWTELPPIKDMSRLRIGSSTCQVEGEYVPVADINLATGDSVYFAHHVLLWKDPQVEVRRMSMGTAIERMLAGLPVVMTEAHGPGHIAFSRDEPGEMIALPLNAGASIDVREHLLLVATSGVNYSSFDTGVWYSTQRRDETEAHYPAGRYMDRFTAVGGPGLMLLHAAGNVFFRKLDDGQRLLIKPRALVYKDQSVSMSLRVQYPTGYYAASHRLIWLELIGPGRVAIQSAYEPVEDDGCPINGQSPWNFAFPGSTFQTGRALPMPDPYDAVMTSGRRARAIPPDVLANLRMRIAKMATEALVNGRIPPLAMQRLLDAAEAEGLSAHDATLIVKHLESHGG